MRRRPLFFQSAAFSLIILTALACTPNGDNDDAGPDLGRTQTTEGGTYTVTYTPDPDPFTSQMDFALDVTVAMADDSALPDDLSIEADAFMPEHGHGMLETVDPQVTDQGDGKFRVEGMNLLMGGQWEIYIDVSSAGETERATFTVQVEGEGGHMMDGGMHMGDGGHMHMGDGGMHMEGDAGHMHMGDGGMHMEGDAGHMHMGDGGMHMGGDAG